MRICIIGGGGLGHTCSGVLSSHTDIVVDMLTKHPEKWSHNFRVNAPEGKVFNGKLDVITSDPSKVIPNADIVFLCLPAFCVEDNILEIKPFLKPDTIVGTVVANSGFFIFCHKHLSANTKLFGLQRVPYVSRVVEYGKEANLLGYRDALYVAMENIEDKESLRNFIEEKFLETTHLVDSYYEVTLSNSNPILHTGRLYTMWKDWDGKPFDKCSLFYKEWTLEASEVEAEMDKEFFALLHVLGVNTNNIETLLAHYESTTPEGMTNKIQSIESLSTILSPMKEVEGGWMPDFDSRYFTEDFPYGLRFIKELAAQNNVPTPMIDKVYEWGISKCK